jgi:2,3-bisphosphoglycerate-dependent phosphoglycerate mutase
MRTRLLIARHGNTFNPTEEPRRVGVTDLPLVESGLLQGRQLGAYLKQNQTIPDVIFTSTLQRTIQTAQAAQAMMHTNLPMVPLASFDEIDYGIDENQLESAVLARLGKQALEAWDRDAIVPSGWLVDPKAIIQQWQDFAKGLNEQYPGKTILVVTSNGIARFAPYLTGDFATFCKQHTIKLATGGLCLFEYAKAGALWHCLDWNIRPKDLVHLT